MPANLSGEPVAGLTGEEVARCAEQLRWRGRVWLLALNCLPLLQVGILLGTCFIPWSGCPVRLGVAVAGLYLLPALVARLLLLGTGIPPGRIAVGSRAFFRWWALFQLQVIFCRLPLLEELLRLVPGLYSQWLRLWGARIGRFTYWSAGMMITDRSFLDIGNDVVFGAGVRLNPHVLTKGTEGQLQLLLAPVKIGDRTMIGGYALLTAGTEIAPDEVTRACLISRPFTVWKNGCRQRSPTMPECE